MEGRGDRIDNRDCVLDEAGRSYGKKTQMNAMMLLASWSQLVWCCRPGASGPGTHIVNARNSVDVLLDIDDLCIAAVARDERALFHALPLKLCAAGRHPKRTGQTSLRTVMAVPILIISRSASRRWSGRMSRLGASSTWRKCGSIVDAGGGLSRGSMRVSTTYTVRLLSSNARSETMHASSSRRRR